MNVRIISFSAKGNETSANLASKLNLNGWNAENYAMKKHCKAKGTLELTGTLHQWTEESFKASDAIIFVCAAGIAVRSIAPFVKSKTEDPAVIVMDEKGTYAIPVLSGHLGGANELAMLIEKETGAEAIITTATDINNKFAVDVFAKNNHLYIMDMVMAKNISAAVLENKTIGVVSDLPVIRSLPKGLVLAAEGEDMPEYGICISDENRKPFKYTLNLKPCRYYIGIGCRKGKGFDEIESFVLDLIKVSGIALEQIEGIASIDVKQHEEGILELSRKYNIPFQCFSAGELNELKGEFSASSFVKGTVGVDNVCERSAVKAASTGNENGTLIIKKTCRDGITLAVAQKKEEICFE